ncbi:MAG TPA: hypothetical protein VKB62_10065 [Streptosporangiaceae bacterium]|nr:hypothetical protein [Streptosporangiaceae bacterium]
MSAATQDRQDRQRPTREQERARAELHSEVSGEHAPRDARTLTRVVQVALVRVHARRLAWTRAELMRQIKLSLPAEQLGLGPDAAVSSDSPERLTIRGVV